jgi:hypothetical protein
VGGGVRAEEEEEGIYGGEVGEVGFFSAFTFFAHSFTSPRLSPRSTRLDHDPLLPLYLFALVLFSSSLYSFVSIPLFVPFSVCNVRASQYVEDE